MLERHQDTLIDQTMLWLDPPEPHALIRSSDCCITPLRSLNQLNPQQWSAPDAPWPAQPDGIVLFYPKAKGRLEWWLQQIQHKAPKARLWIVGENLGGIKSLPKRLDPWASCEKLDTARHCALFEVHPQQPIPTSESWQAFDWQGHRIQALPGVFSQNRLDTGTAVLLSQLPALDGQLFELGCGSGVLSLALLSQNPKARLITTDIDWMAVTSTQHNLDNAGLAERAEVIWSDGLGDIPKQRFDHLITNPPFHSGLRTHYEPSERFFAASHDWLNSGGSLWWVTNDFLDYQSALKAGAFNVQEVVRERGFKVYKAVRK